MNMSRDSNQNEQQAHALSHVMSRRMLLTVFASLLVLTAITVAMSHVSLGRWEIWVSLGIATLKASLVAVYFMHLRYDAPLNAALFVFSLAFVALFLGLTMIDSVQYQPDLMPPPADQIGTGVP